MLPGKFVGHRQMPVKGVHVMIDRHAEMKQPTFRGVRRFHLVSVMAPFCVILVGFVMAGKRLYKGQN